MATTSPLESMTVGGVRRLSTYFRTAGKKREHRGHRHRLCAVRVVMDNVIWFLTSNAGKLKDGMNVGNSDDSGIIARPTSSASKSDASLSRPDSSSSDQPIKQNYHQERSSPIGSEQSKQANPVHNQSKIVENGANQHPVSSSNQMTTIITLKSNGVNNNNPRAVRKSSNVKKGRKGEERAWYDVSDEDVDIQTPDHITSIISVRGSSDEDPF